MATPTPDIAATIEALVEARAVGATVCPSEVARALADDSAAWRALMPEVRAAAAELARSGRLSVTRGGIEVDALAPGGPIRLGRPRRVGPQATGVDVDADTDSASETDTDTDDNSGVDG